MTPLLLPAATQFSAQVRARMLPAYCEFGFIGTACHKLASLVPMQVTPTFSTGSGLHGYKASYKPWTMLVCSLTQICLKCKLLMFCSTNPTSSWKLELPQVKKRLHAKVNESEGGRERRVKDREGDGGRERERGV